MTRRLCVFSTATAIAAAAFAPSIAVAQDSAILPARPRTQDERTNTQQATPPPVNSDAFRAATGQLPAVPATPAAPGAPATPIVGGGGVSYNPNRAMDPAARIGEPVVGAPGVVNGRPVSVGVGRPAAPAGMDVAMLVEHALGMAIEASALQAIAEPTTAAEDATSPKRLLVEKAKGMMAASKGMMTSASADGTAVPANSPVRRFYGAANQYAATLGGLGTLSPSDRAQVAMVNCAVKSVLDANHILAMGPVASGSAALDQLVAHAREMKAAGTEAVARMAGPNPVDPAAPASPMLLAQRAREVIDAADGLGMGFVPATGLAPAVGAAIAPGAVPSTQPGRFQNDQPEIIGGTFGAGSAAVGTANTRNPATPGTVPPPATPDGAPGSGTSNYGTGNNNTPRTNTNGGLPRP